MLTLHRMLIMAFVSALVSCGGGDGGSGIDRAELSVFDVLTEAQLDAIETLGVQINLGDSPPDIEGTFVVDPLVLQATSVADSQDSIGSSFFPIEITFANQDNTAGTVEFTIQDDANLEIVSTSSFVSGSGNAFTAFFLTETTRDGQTFEASDTYSAIVTDSGLENFQRALIVIDDRGDPNDIITPNDTGNLFIDLDGFSERLLP